MEISVSQIDTFCVQQGLPRLSSMENDIPPGASHRVYKLRFGLQAQWADERLPEVLALRVPWGQLLPKQSSDTTSNTSSNTPPQSPYTSLTSSCSMPSRQYLEILRGDDVVSTYDKVAPNTITDYAETESDVNKRSDVISETNAESEDRIRFRDEVACAIFIGNYSQIGPRVYSYGCDIDSALETPWLLTKFVSGTTLESQLPDLSPTQQYAVSELLVSLLQRTHQIPLPAQGRIRASPNMKDKGVPHLWTSDQHRDVIVIQSMSSGSDDHEHITMASTLPQVNSSNAKRLPTLVQQLKRKLENWKEKATDWHLSAFESECETLLAILDFIEGIPLHECTPMQSWPVVWHQDLAPRNILIEWSLWETHGIVDATLIDWDGALSAHVEHTIDFPVRVFLSCTRFAKTLSSDSIRDLHHHSKKLLSKVFPNRTSAQVAINQLLHRIISIIDGEFSLEWCIDLCYEVCKEWADWRALVVQERCCSLDAPPPGERFEDERDAEANLSDDTGDITSVIAECEEIQETPEADDLVTADTCVEECDGHGVSY